MYTYRIYHGTSLWRKNVDRHYAMPFTLLKYFQNSPDWVEGEREQVVDFSDKSGFSNFKRYIDGTEPMTDKYILSEVLSEEYIPETYTIDRIKDLKEAMAEADEELGWMLKNTAFNVGEGKGVANNWCDLK